MKKKWIILISLWILSVIGISFYGGAVSYGIFAVLTLLPVIALIYLLCVYLCLRIYQRNDFRALVSSRPSSFFFTLQNEGPILLSGVRIALFSSFSTIDGLDDSITYEIAPHKGIKIESRIVCKYRGEYEVGIKKIILTDFLRLFTITYQNSNTLSVIVKPNIIELEELKSVKESLNSVLDTKLNPVKPDVFTREYVSTDDMRYINWKQTAAMQKLMVRETVGEQQEGIGIIMDSQRISEDNAVFLPQENKVLEIVIALTLHYTNKHVPVSVYTLEDSVQEKLIDQRSFENFYEDISAFIFMSAKSQEMLISELRQYASVYRKRTVFMILNRMGTEAYELAERIIENGCAVGIYIVTNKKLENQPDIRIPGAAVVPVDVDDDIREVL